MFAYRGGYVRLSQRTGYDAHRTGAIDDDRGRNGHWTLVLNRRRVDDGQARRAAVHAAG